MLAEPKYKLKWAEDPRNINWSKDTNKYGYKMLSKMGWSEGKGLGANENGATSHVKVSKRKENLGLGASTFNEDNWLSHQDEFSALLSKLNQKDSKGHDDLQKSSLQKNVQSSERKILYTKFIKSKDLSLKSKNDLACIFGQRSQSTPATPQDLSEDEDSKSDTSIASCPATATTEACHEGFVTVKSEMNLKEYFASKMAALKQKSEVRFDGGSTVVKGELEGVTDGVKKKKKAKKDKAEKLEYKLKKSEKNIDKMKRRNIKNADCFDQSDAGISECFVNEKAQGDLKAEEEIEPKKMRKKKKKKDKIYEDEEENVEKGRKEKKSSKKTGKLKSLETEGIEENEMEDKGIDLEQNLLSRKDEILDMHENINVKKLKKKKRNENTNYLERNDMKKEEDGIKKKSKFKSDDNGTKEVKICDNDGDYKPREKKRKKMK